VPSTDKLTIDTPELIALELPLAGIGSRFLALAIDSLLQLIIGIIVLLISLMLILVLGNFFKNFGVAVTVLILYCLYWGYFAFFEIIWNGQTPGKRMVRIRVIKESGRPITPLEAIGRNIMRAIDMLPGVFYVVGLICMMLNNRNKRLGDFVAGTVLVHENKIEAVSAIWNPGALSPLTDLQTAKITGEELLLIETYLNRRNEFDLLVRKKTARQIISMITDRTGVERIEGQSDDAFLEAVARKVRDNARYR
jgi:uncharacterized RDD family membrane protein YckC